MKDVTSKIEQPISHLKESLKSVRTSFEKVSSIPEETFNKWRIGRRNFP